MTTKERNQKYYQAHREELKQKKLDYYHTIYKEQINREHHQEYMKEYFKTHERKTMTPEMRAEIHRRRRERYATDPEYAASIKAKARDWARRNPTKKKAQRLREKFGMELDYFHQMIQKQDGQCAICGMSDTTDPNVFPLIDHEHKTGRVRGLLCGMCNRGLGNFRDNPEFLMAAIRYLNNTSSGVISIASRSKLEDSLEKSA
jgi:Recombination endonuclease VII